MIILQGLKAAKGTVSLLCLTSVEKGLKIGYGYYN